MRAKIEHVRPEEVPDFESEAAKFERFLNFVKSHVPCPDDPQIKASHGGTGESYAFLPNHLEVEFRIIANSGDNILTKVHHARRIFIQLKTYLNFYLSQAKTDRFHVMLSKLGQIHLDPDLKDRVRRDFRAYSISLSEETGVFDFTKRLKSFSKLNQTFSEVRDFQTQRDKKFAEMRQSGNVPRGSGKLARYKAYCERTDNAQSTQFSFDDKEPSQDSTTTPIPAPVIRIRGRRPPQFKVREFDHDQMQILSEI